MRIVLRYSGLVLVGQFCLIPPAGSRSLAGLLFDLKVAIGLSLGRVGGNERALGEEFRGRGGASQGGGGGAGGHRQGEHRTAGESSLIVPSVFLQCALSVP